MPQIAQVIKFWRVQETRITADLKPITEPRQGTCYIRPIGQDNKPPIHPLNTCRIRYGPIHAIDNHYGER